MRILFISKSPLDRRYGAAKLLVELASALEALGAECTLVDPPALGCDLSSLASASAAYLHREAERYDVVEFDYKHLRFEALQDLQKRTHSHTGAPLFVARCQLWRGHMLRVPPPPLPGLRAQLGYLVRRGKRTRKLQARVESDIRLMNEADLVIVSNEHDCMDLTDNYGVVPGHIAVIRPGFDAGAAEALGRAAEHAVEDPPVVAFVGTFDERKGGGDFPTIVDRLSGLIPSIRFRLLGTKGMLKTKRDVLRCFSRRHRSRIEVVPTYTPGDLPALLAGCAAGVFPSYAEGFGYGVLEMLAAGLPVFAYDRPGPPVMLPSEYLVPAGQPEMLASKLATLIREKRVLDIERGLARDRAQQFNWEQTAKETLKTYREAVERVNTAPA